MNIHVFRVLFDYIAKLSNRHQFDILSSAQTV